MDTTNRKGMEKLYLKRLFILLFLFPASLWAQDALSETPVRSTDTEAINEIVTGLNTVWMLLAAMLVFFSNRDSLWWKLDLSAPRIPPTY